MKQLVCFATSKKCLKIGQRPPVNDYRDLAVDGIYLAVAAVTSGRWYAIVEIKSERVVSIRSAKG